MQPSTVRYAIAFSCNFTYTKYKKKQRTFRILQFRELTVLEPHIHPVPVGAEDSEEARRRHGIATIQEHQDALVSTVDGALDEKRVRRRGLHGVHGPQEPYAVQQVRVGHAAEVEEDGLPGKPAEFTQQTQRQRTQVP